MVESTRTGVMDVDAGGFVDRHRTALQEVGEPLYETVAEAMRAQAHGSWESMMHESLVRAAVVRYVADHEGEAAAAAEARAQVEAGFVWTSELAELMRRFQDRPDDDTGLDGLMPEVVSLLRSFIE